MTHSTEGPAQPNSRLQLIVAVVTLSAVTAFIIFIGVAIVVQAAGPEPGDVMVLMALPFVCILLGGLACVFLIGALFAKPRLPLVILASVALLSAVGLVVAGQVVEHGTLFTTECVVEFRNSSDTAVYVDEVIGFEADPACGNLAPGASKVAHFVHNKFADEFKIKWRLIVDGAQNSSFQTSSVSIAKIPASQRDGTIVFDFGSHLEWSVQFEPLD